MILQKKGCLIDEYAFNFQLWFRKLKDSKFLLNGWLVN
jgi:hypothetical protein